MSPSGTSSTRPTSRTTVREAIVPNVTICASANPNDPGANCGGTWDQGYIVFIDTDGDLNRAGATEVILRSHGEAETGVTFNFESGATYFSYSQTGQGRGDVGGKPLGAGISRAFPGFP